MSIGLISRLINFLNLNLIACLLFCFITRAQTFSDVTSASGIIDITEFTNIYGTGASVVDYNNDGYLDFFVGTEFNLFNQLYRNNGDGTFIELAQESGINSLYRNRASLWIDYDNDQLLDLILIGDCYEIDNCQNSIEIFVYKQNQDNYFSRVLDSGLGFRDKYAFGNYGNKTVVGGLAAADINNDGLLDLLVSVWEGPMTFFLNNGDNTFSDISTTSGVGLTTKYRHQPTFHDFNHDGYMDINITIDFDENEFWLNNGDNTFQEIGASIGVNSAFNEMGIAIGDYDNDGDFDLYATNITGFQGGVQEHNILLKNNWSSTNSLSFSEIAQEPNFDVGISGWDWGTTFFDADNDGYIDLATTNGWIENDWPSDQSKLWKNVDGLLFQDISDASSFNDSWNALTLLAFDMDRDGDLDLLQSMKINPGEFKPVRLYENDAQSTNSNNYLVIKPRMNVTNHFSIGAVVKIVYDEGTKTAMRLITAGTSFYGQEPAEAFFGLADNTIVDEVRIEWPDNTVTVVDDVVANQVITVNNDSTLDIESAEITEIKAYPNPVNDIIYLENSSLIKEVQVYNLLGQLIIQKDFNSENIKLNLINLNSGSYFIKVIDISNSASKTIRIIKQ